MNLQELANCAWDALESNRLSEARRLFGDLVRRDAGDAEAWLILGTLDGAFGDVPSAMAALGRALALEPDYVDAHVGLGKMHLLQGRPGQALNALRDAVAFAPETTDAWLLLAGVYGRLDRFDEAEVASRRALALAPESVEARLHLANALRGQGQRGTPEADTWIARPVFVTGLPRSGTSLIAGCLTACGAWVGKTLDGNASNPTGYYENAVLRESVLKAQLVQMGTDPLGVRQLPPLSGQPAQPKLGGQVLALLAGQGYTGIEPWLYKDAKLTLVWPVWRSAFPHARWVIVRRPPAAIVASCMRTDFMRQHSVEPEFWDRWVKMYEQRLEVLKASGVWWREFESDRLFSEGPEALEVLCSDLDLSWDARVVGELVRPQHWHAKIAKAPAIIGRTEPQASPPLVVNSVPKSGTHLLGKLVNLLGYSDLPVRLYNNLAPLGMSVEETVESVRVGSVWPCQVPLEQLAEILLKVRTAQFVQGHLPYSPRVAQLLDAFGLRMILVLRDPRAVAVSHANWVPEREYLASHEFYRDKSADERLRLAISGYRIEPDGPLELGLRTRFEHMLPWMEQPNVYTTRFEWLAGPEAGGTYDMQMRELRSIAAHLDLDADNDRLEQIAGQLFGGTMTFRGGQIADWQSSFREEHRQLIKDEMGDIIVQLGYEEDAYR